MALDPCDPCGCISGNESTWSFYQKALQVLCQIKAALTGGGNLKAATFDSNIVDGTTIDTTGVPVLNTGDSYRIVTALNTTDKDLLLSFDAGGSYPYPLAAGGGTLAIDLAANGLYSATSIWAKAAVSDPTAGELYIGITI